MFTDDLLKRCILISISLLLMGFSNVIAKCITEYKVCKIYMSSPTKDMDIFGDCVGNAKTKSFTKTQGLIFTDNKSKINYCCSVSDSLCNLMYGVEDLGDIDGAYLVRVKGMLANMMKTKLENIAKPSSRSGIIHALGGSTTMSSLNPDDIDDLETFGTSHDKALVKAPMGKSVIKKSAVTERSVDDMRKCLNLIKNMKDSEMYEALIIGLNGLFIGGDSDSIDNELFKYTCNVFYLIYYISDEYNSEILPNNMCDSLTNFKTKLTLLPTQLTFSDCELLSFVMSEMELDLSRKNEITKQRTNLWKTVNNVGTGIAALATANPLAPSIIGGAVTILNSLISYSSAKRMYKRDIEKTIVDIVRLVIDDCKGSGDSVDLINLIKTFALINKSTIDKYTICIPSSKMFTTNGSYRYKIFLQKIAKFNHRIHNLSSKINKIKDHDISTNLQVVGGAMVKGRENFEAGQVNKKILE